MLLLDADTLQTVQESAVLAQNGSYDFSFEDVEAGAYVIVAGTDSDNDVLICDPGEACGAYLTIDQPLTENFEADRSDIDFPIEYLISLPGTASAAANGRIPRTLELKRQENPP